MNRAIRAEKRGRSPFFSLLCCLLIFVGCTHDAPHTPVNSLPLTLPTCAVFAGGAVYFLKDGVLTCAAEDVYDPASGALRADYAADAGTQTLLFCREQTLVSARNGEKTVVGSNVKTWRTCKGLHTVVFTTPFQEERDSALGTLFCFRDKTLTPLDEGVDAASVTLSSDGRVAYALKPNGYPQTGARLYRYDLQTFSSSEVLSDCAALFWIGADGDTVITAAKSGSDTYDYTIYADSFRKSLTETGGFLPSVTADGQYLYLLCRYENGAGELDRIDLKTLSRKTLARDVAFFSSDAVTDPQKGVVYSVRTGEGEYAFYYVRANGKSVRLMRKAPASSITGIAIDSLRETGYLLAPGAVRQDTALYRVTLAGESADAVRLMTGDLSDLVYYEEDDTALCLKDASSSGGTLVRARADGAETLGECGASDGRALAVLSGEAVLCVTRPDETLSGTLELLPAHTCLAQNVPAGELLAPVASREFAGICYLSADEAGTYTLYHYAAGRSEVLLEKAQGLAALYEEE